MIIVGAYSNAHGNDKQEFIPTIESVPDQLSTEISTAMADTGYFSEKNIADCKQKNIEPIISTAPEKHNSFLTDILTNNPLPEVCKTPTEKMNKLLERNIQEKKQTVEPVFGIIKEILGFRRFSLRGEEETNAEWSLVCTAYNLKRFFKMQMA
jgi:transposase